MFDIAEDNRNDIGGSFNQQKRERCVVCGKETAYCFNQPISQRQFYVEGAGQLCQECYMDIYRKNQKK